MNDRHIIKIILYNKKYHGLINSSLHHYDELIKNYGSWKNEYNDLKAVKTLYRLKIPYPDYLETTPIDNAAKNNNMELLIYLYYNKLGKYTYRAVDYAAKNNNFEMVKFLIERRRVHHEVRAAFSYHGYNIPQSFIEAVGEGKFTQIATQIAGQHKNTKMLQYLQCLKKKGFMVNN